MALDSPSPPPRFSDPAAKTPAITLKTAKSTLKLVNNASSSPTCNPTKISKKSVPDVASDEDSTPPDFASDEDSTPHDSMATLNRIRPPRHDWYEELYAFAMDKMTKSYEAEIAGYKSELFANLRGKAKKILEIGIGTGPNLKYYADCPGIDVFGVDPNRKMEKYAREAAATVGLPPSNFRFMQGVAEALPLKDASFDAVVASLVLCSVTDVDQALQEVRRVLKPGGFYIFIEHVAAEDGKILRFVQGILNPLQKAVGDGCHLTRNTATNIARAGFAKLDFNRAVLSSALFVNPHVYGIAYK